MGKNYFPDSVNLCTHRSRLNFANTLASRFGVEPVQIENDLLKCYEIAKQLWQYIPGAAPEESEYRIHEGPTVGDGAITRLIEDFIQSFRESEGGRLKTQDGNRPPGTASERQQRAPMIDLL